MRVCACARLYIKEIKNIWFSHKPLCDKAFKAISAWKFIFNPSYEQIMNDVRCASPMGVSQLKEM